MNHQEDKRGQFNVSRLKEKLGGFFGRFKGTGAFISKNKKNIIVCASVLAVCGAVYLNYYIFHEPEVSPAAPAENTGTDAGDDYFSSAVISRQKARDEAMDVLKQVADSTDALEEVKNEAYSGINSIAKEIECESNIEQLIISKGFEQCLAVVNEGSASIIVKSDGLLANEIAQIKEIVYLQAGILPKDIKIIEKS